MNRNLLILLSFILPLTACGFSPILNHTTPGRTGFFSQQNEETKCDFAFETQDLCASLHWTKMPDEDANHEGEFTLTFWNRTISSETGPFITPAGDVTVKLWMPDMGHGSTRVMVKPLTDDVGSVLPGIFTASPIHFVMGGEWEIWVQLKNGSAVLDQAKITLTVAD